jgi:cytoskeletal protein CcmA (bactofilin family)
MTEKTNHKTVLGADCRITGELSLDNDAVIMGHFNGTLRVSGVLELTDSAKVSGTIIAGALRLAGSVEGDVVAEHGAELLAGAQFNGQLYTTRLSVIEGAVFQGDVCVGPKAMQAAGSLLQQAEQAVGLEQDQLHLHTEAHEATGDLQDDAAWDEAQEEEAQDQPMAEPAAPVRTVSSSLNSILERRRAKPMPVKAGSIRSSAGSADRVA